MAVYDVRTGDRTKSESLLTEVASSTDCDLSQIVLNHLPHHLCPF